MSIPDDLLEIMQCISCAGGLEQGESVLICTECGLRYPVEHGIPVMLPEAAFRPEGE